MIGIVRRWLSVGHDAFRGRRRDMRPTPLSDVLAQAPGCWIAVDRTTNEPRAISTSPYELTAQIRQQDLKNIAIVRAPDPSEPELVGLG